MSPFLRSPFLRRSWWVTAGTVLVVVVAAVVQRCPEWWGRDASSGTPQAEAAAGGIRVARVVDGDTIVLADRRERVRLIGANTPETVKPHWPVEPWGPEASAFTKQFLAGGMIRLEFDGDHHDRYGRMLAYVWVGDRMLNEELIRAGLARAETQYRYSKEKKALFRRAEAEAKAAKRGIWSSGKTPTRPGQF